MRAGTVSRLAADSESSECTSSQMRLTTLALFDCRWPMKCHRNVSPYSACLRSRSCARFSPTVRTPASASTAMSLGETYFVAATIVTPSPISLWMRARFVRTVSGDVADHSLTTRDAAVAAVREETVRIARSAEVEALERADTRLP